MKIPILLVFTVFCCLIWGKGWSQVSRDSSLLPIDSVNSAHPFKVKGDSVIVLQPFLQPRMDSLPKPQVKGGKRTKFGKWIKKGYDAIKRNHPRDTSDKTIAYHSRIENYYQPYAGKVIRHIEVRQFGFEKSFSDTATKIRYFGTNLLNSLHNNSKSWVIRNNLFIHEDDRLSPAIIADNERYLRNLNFIRDARILVKTIDPSSDSVDLLVVTKDLFSLTGEVSSLDLDHQQITIGDENLMGLGQSLEVTGLHDPERKPKYGIDARYEKYNVFNSFLNVSGGYADIGRNLYNYKKNERSYFLNLDRPLYSQYARTFGFLHMTNAWSEHSFEPFIEPDSAFYKYHYKMLDVAFGYNFGARRHLQSTDVPLRKVISFRYFNYNFKESPQQFVGRFVEKLNDRQAFLTKFTLFKQKFFKTRYILGFGATEDIPYGYNFSLTGGWYRIKDLSRPYIGLDANRYAYTEKGDILQFFLRTGSYFREGLQDGNLLLGTSLYSRLVRVRQLKVRQFMRMSYSSQFNTAIAEPLRINNAFGLQDFRQDSIQAKRRLTLRSETIFFSPGKVFGFSFAPFLTGDFSLIEPTKQSIDPSHFYYGLGGGIRTRNENLVFGTIELKAIYFPRKIYGQNQFKIGLTTNLRFRYNSSYVSAPEFVQVNNDIRNDIF
ncbi:BamA/TamA family outer membrane protein [Arachidicoccus rhizosphaerae]|uniref:hypothetical protein n=1 Tax=Arachidicoccus rhizosphaerae TaxID=551991 RepID=UPI001113EB0F|nr:hypothetical protein [Arachidicoccus rhizosphaerae]